MDFLRVEILSDVPIRILGPSAHVPAFRLCSRPLSFWTIASQPFAQGVLSPGDVKSAGLVSLVPVEKATS